MEYLTRVAELKDINNITNIYNQGIEDRIATLETRLRTEEEMNIWLNTRNERHIVLVIENGNGDIFGWASINGYNSRCCYDGVGDLSIYIERSIRAKGLGKILLYNLLKIAKEKDFHKIILSVFEENKSAQGLYKSVGFREVGTFIEQGVLNGRFINITLMEKLL